MAIEFNCPHCGAFYRLDEKFAGKMGKCKNAKCQQPILIPFQSTAKNAKPVAPQKIDAEALAAAAFGEEPPPVKETVVTAVKKIPITCQFCDHKFEVEASMAGKNTACPECRKIIRVPKMVEEKPADWRTGASGRPSMAKATEPVPTGAWESQRKGVSGEALRKAGALEVEDDEDPGERRLRRIKRVLYGLAILGTIAFAVIYLRSRINERKEERGMDSAVKEIEDKNEGSKKPEFHAAIHRFAGEYHVRNAADRDQLASAIKWFDKSRDELQNLPPSHADRSAMLGELGASLVVCGGDANEISKEIRLPWEKVHPLIRKCLDKIPPAETELRTRALRSVTRKLAAKEQGALAATVARNCGNAAEQPELVGRVGIELFLIGKKDLAAQILSKMPSGAQPSSTALWLALHSDLERPPNDFPHVALPDPKSLTTKPLTRDARLAYAEGFALQGKWDKARDITKFPGSAADRLDALVRVAAVAADTGNADEAAKTIENVLAILKAEGKAPTGSSWLLARSAELAFTANKPEMGQEILDLLKDDDVKSWAKLEILRLKLAGQRKEKADETWVENVPQPENANLAQALMREEVARHNAVAGESSYTRSVEAMAKGIIRPFGYAGTALGLQDRAKK